MYDNAIRCGDAMMVRLLNTNATAGQGYVCPSYNTVHIIANAVAPPKRNILDDHLSVFCCFDELLPSFA